MCSICTDRHDAVPDCGSRLAGDGVRQGAARLQGLIAGKPAPTGCGSFSVCFTPPGDVLSHSLAFKAH
ncbi:hypothetical protein CCU68_14510 [Pseudomonas gingeri NCPPB 3146 = LMG 5327]|uniref:Uncharacterized protein n=1 Tax=Pseudomonas gingeri NCPPB 3146 = LMG 5327 TaxID=707248 RepID=A0ABX4Y3J4_9PSED|nr:hypothetical protein CCU68_14510 [Pseudomonas gingeri NCPPB 3146 = LMG 5327]